MNNGATPCSKIKHVHHVYKISPRCGIVVKVLGFIPLSFELVGILSYLMWIALIVKVFLIRDLSKANDKCIDSNQSFFVSNLKNQLLSVWSVWNFKYTICIDKRMARVWVWGVCWNLRREICNPTATVSLPHSCQG